MPNYTVYISPEHDEAWRALPNKSEFIRSALIKELNKATDATKPPTTSYPINPTNTKHLPKERVTETEQTEIDTGPAIDRVKKVFPNAEPLKVKPKGAITYKPTSNWGA